MKVTKYTILPFLKNPFFFPDKYSIPAECNAERTVPDRSGRYVFH